MAQEIERKFLVIGDYKKFVAKETKIVQGFLSTVPERTVRIRIKGNQGFLTIKGIGNKSGASRFEFEKEISIDDAKDLMDICEPGVIEKIRYIVPIDKDLIFSMGIIASVMLIISTPNSWITVASKHLEIHLTFN